MTYNIFILPSAQKDCDRLTQQVYQRCRKAMLRLEKEPRPSDCKKLVGNEGYRLRIGDYQVLYRIDDRAKRIYIYRVKHRSAVYR